MKYGKKIDTLKIVIFGSILAIFGIFAITVLIICASSADISFAEDLENLQTLSIAD